MRRCCATAAGTAEPQPELDLLAAVVVWLCGSESHCNVKLRSLQDYADLCVVAVPDSDDCVTDLGTLRYREVARLVMRSAGIPDRPQSFET